MMKTVRYPEGHTLLRNLNKDFPVCTYGKGVHLYDAENKRYFDASGGALVVTLGHGNEELAHDIYEQIKRVAYVNGTQFTTPVMEECSALLAERAKPLGLDKVALLASGSEAVEAAVKFARQLWVDRGRPDKHKLIARVPGYHGNTMYALSASGRPHYKKVYGPLLSPVITVTAPYGYRAPFVQTNDPDKILQEYHAKGADFYARELETLIEKEGASSISAFILEPVSGSSTGAWFAPRGYMQRIQEICRKHEILIIADEVMCGAGRTGKFFASEHDGLKPDILVMGKGINSGMMPVSALLVKKSDTDTMKNATGNFMHAQTYMQTPAMAATGCAVLSYLKKHQVLEKSKTVSDHWLSELKQHILPLPYVGSIQGIGHMAGVEFVADKATKTPFPIAKRFAQTFVQHAQNHGLILWANYGQADGVNGDLVIMGPSLEMTMKESDECVALLKNAIETFMI
ncbi:MAG: aspartate aminotransferase family protein [Bdellovibrionales bacterium]|nr:aspartate aminotransferase family protein [Bdellovibrionales bacterium]